MVTHGQQGAHHKNKNKNKNSFQVVGTGNHKKTRHLHEIFLLDQKVIRNGIFFLPCLKNFSFLSMLIRPYFMLWYAFWSRASQMSMVCTGIYLQYADIIATIYRKNPFLIGAINWQCRIWRLCDPKSKAHQYQLQFFVSLVLLRLSFNAVT